MAEGENGRRSVSGMIEGIQGIQQTLMLEHARLDKQATDASASANIVKQQIEVLQQVLEAPFSQPGERPEG